MQIPRFILVTFLAVLVGGTLLATALLVSSSEPDLGESIVMTPEGTTPPSIPTNAPSSTPAAPTTPAPSAAPTTPAPSATPMPPVSPAPPPNGAIEVPACAPLTGDEDCDDDWDDYWDDYWDDLDDN